MRHVGLRLVAGVARRRLRRLGCLALALALLALARLLALRLRRPCLRLALGQQREGRRSALRREQHGAPPLAMAAGGHLELRRLRLGEAALQAVEACVGHLAGLLLILRLAWEEHADLHIMEVLGELLRLLLRPEVDVRASAVALGLGILRGQGVLGEVHEVERALVALVESLEQVVWGEARGDLLQHAHCLCRCSRQHAAERHPAYRHQWRRIHHRHGPCRPTTCGCRTSSAAALSLGAAGPQRL
mmetsp:Transcript_59785/g.153992  ORF Transcript_59785/g.153992 Transcript_59785/m.153992 type:complete len:246 (-) Transcript_59785:994-1731(-)